MSAQEARRQALIKLGGIEQTKEIYRDRRGIPLVIPDDIASAVLGPLTKSQPVWVVGTRDGRRQQWLYLNAGACPG